MAVCKVYIHGGGAGPHCSMAGEHQTYIVRFICITTTGIPWSFLPGLFYSLLGVTNATLNRSLRWAATMCVGLGPHFSHQVQR